ncbi:MAG TPA: hypothetical protein VFF65_07645 [Phycisphaerales bacterium]|nr:hypothetical protein [Phycisphaerales bacterium]
MNDSPRGVQRVDRPAIGAALLVLAMVALMVMAMFQVGCTQHQVGSSASFDAAKASLVNGGPVTLDIRDKSKSGTATGVGPARYTSVTAAGVETMSHGLVNRDVFAEVARDGTVKFNLSAGTDISGEGIEFNHKTGALKVAKFTTSASDPLRAHAEHVKLWGPVYVKALEQARLGNRDLYDSVVKSVESLGPLVLEGLKLAHGVP